METNTTTKATTLTAKQKSEISNFMLSFSEEIYKSEKDRNTEFKQRANEQRKIAVLQSLVILSLTAIHIWVGVLPIALTVAMHLVALLCCTISAIKASIGASMRMVVNYEDISTYVKESEEKATVFKTEVGRNTYLTKVRQARQESLSEESEWRAKRIRSATRWYLAGAVIFLLCCLGAIIVCGWEAVQCLITAIH